MTTIVIFFAIYALAFLIKEAAGPWSIFSKIRNALMLNKYVGVFFFQLLECYFCVGFHCGYIVYLLSEKSYTWQFFILWGLAGGAICVILDALVTRLYAINPD